MTTKNNENNTFGYPIALFNDAIDRCPDAKKLLEQVNAFSKLIATVKNKIVLIKRNISGVHCELVYTREMIKFNFINAPEQKLESLKDEQAAYIEQLHEYQEDLHELYIKHNQLVEQLKTEIKHFAMHNICAFRVKQFGNTDIPEKKIDDTTSFTLDREGVVELIRQLVVQYKSKPDCNKFVLNITNAGVTVKS